MKSITSVMYVLGFAITLAGPVTAQTFFFSTGNPDGRIATASRPSSAGKIETESADDFAVTQKTLLNHATFTGLITSPSYSIESVSLEIYRVFPFDSDIPPSGNVLTRVNSPSDIAYIEFSSTTPSLTFSTTLLNASFTAANSVVNGIHPLPNSFTGGDGPITGQEVSFDITLHDGIVLTEGHYFFVPQVLVSGGASNPTADFLWLSAPKPITDGTPFRPDLQTWIRNEELAPDWLRVGTDITGQGPFNASFSVSGVSLSPVPEPSIYGLSGVAALVLIGAVRKSRAWRASRSV